MLPLVSVLITTYNRQNLLARCIESVLQQTYPNLEIIIVNDCSTDNTQNLLSQYTSSYKIIKSVTNVRRSGNSFSRNLAFANSSGPYIAFLDDDDYWINSDKIKLQVDYLITHSLHTISCTQIYTHGTHGFDIHPIRLPTDMRFQLLQGNEVIHNSTVLLHRDLLIESKGFDENLSRGIDSELFRRLLFRHGCTFSLLLIPTTFYETSGLRITTSRSIKSIITLCFCNIYIILKYWRELLFSPKALSIRLANLIRQPLFLICNL